MGKMKIKQEQQAAIYHSIWSGTGVCLMLPIQTK